MFDGVFMRVVIKVGSQSILDENGNPLLAVMTHLVEQIIQLKEAGNQIVLVSSGAVALGRMLVRKTLSQEYGNSVADKQVLASLGQPQLMQIYAKLFGNYGYLTSQLLLTKYDFQTKRSYTNIVRLLENSLVQKNIITIINENDSVAVEELMFTDNDELSGIVAAQLGAEKLLLLTSIDGVYTKNPLEAGAELIREIRIKDTLPDLSGKTLFGRGGMSSKLNTARKMATFGVTTHIASLSTIAVLTKIILDNQAIGAKILPEIKKSKRKKYLAFMQVIPNAQLTVNDGVIQALAKTAALSILPIGVEKVCGEFKRGDLLEIVDMSAKKIGVGIARYNSSELSQYIGKRNCPEVIHYDYLHIYLD